jgi:purine nucleoside permease
MNVSQPVNAARPKFPAAAQKASAWRAGFAAGLAGGPVSRCPTAAATIKAWSWFSGSIEGQAQRGKRTTMHNGTNHYCPANEAVDACK